MRAPLLLSMIGLLSPPLWAKADFYLGPRSVAVSPAMNDLLGFAVDASVGPAGSNIAIVSGLDRIVLVGTMLPGEDQFVFGQVITSSSTLDNFGVDVAIGGPEGNVVAIGAPGDDTFFENSGRVDLYRRASPGASYVFEQSLLPPSPGDTANFGTSLAISADGNRLIVGEPKALQANVEVGAVHIYDISTMTIPAPQTLLGGLNVGARFGQSVALDGAFLVVGAPLADDDSLVDRVGAVVVFQDTGGSFSMDGMPLFADDRLSNDRMGLTVTINGDTLVAGAGNDDKPAGMDAGSAYVFRRSGTWTQEAKLRSSMQVAQERFGQSLALRGDELLIGAFCVNASGCPHNGAVYGFSRSGSTWSDRLRYFPSPSDNPSFFGHSMAYADDDTLVVGAYGSDGLFVDQGAAYALKRIDIILSDGFEDPPPPLSP